MLLKELLNTFSENFVDICAKGDPKYTTLFYGRKNEVNIYLDSEAEIEGSYFDDVPKEKVMMILVTK